MAEVRLSPEAESELDQIWLYLADASGSAEIAGRVIDRITGQFWYLAHHPHLGRRRDADLRPGLRSLAADEYVILYRIDADGSILVLHILHGRRDIAAFFAG
jgi:plasmid stabilization system protein ParE